MDIGELLVRDGIVLKSGASSKRQALNVVAAAAAAALNVKPSLVLAALQEREALGSTGLGAGVAVQARRYGVRSNAAIS